MVQQQVVDLLAGLHRGERRSLARLLTWIEAMDARVPSVVEPPGNTADPVPVLGFTGPPGAGKSCLVSRVAEAYRQTSATVGVLAVDPSSPYTGGALLGDRLRMAEHINDPGVFVRSMASRGHAGGLAAAVPAALRAYRAYGFDRILLETVGVGQLEVEVSQNVDVTAVLVAPGSGDDVQARKAGVLEIADILVVNKSDQPGMQTTVRELAESQRLAPHEAGAWRVPVVATNAMTGEGVGELLDAVEQFVAHSKSAGLWEERRRRRRVAEWQTSLVRLVTERIMEHSDQAPAYLEIREQVADGSLHPVDAARGVLDGMAVDGR